MAATGVADTEAAHTGAAPVEEDLEDQERCTRLSAQSAGRSAKCLSSLPKTGLSIARNATGREDLRDSRSVCF